MPNLKNTEISKLKAVSPAKFDDDAVEESLDDLLDNNVLLIRLIGDVINKFFLGDCLQSEAPMN